MTTTERQTNLRRSSRVKKVSKKDAPNSTTSTLKRKAQKLPIATTESKVECAVEEPFEQSIDISAYKAIITDIEGTTTSIAFVKETLFPLVLDTLSEFLAKKWSEIECKSCIEDLRKLSAQDVVHLADDQGHVAIPLDFEILPRAKQIEAVVNNVDWMMSIDRKIGALKNLQGYLWRASYEEGRVKGHVFEDVVPALEEWKKAGKSVYIYSSGSIEAQRLLFEYSEKGNLGHLFKGNFDTSIGLKTVPESYAKILKEIKVDSKDVLFLTDNILENKAARDAGVDSINLYRTGNSPIDNLEGFIQITSFSSLKLANI